PLARSAGREGDQALLRDEPDAALDPLGPQPRTARLQGPPDGSLLPGVARWTFAQALCGRCATKLRRGVEVLDEGCRSHAEMGRMAPGAGRRPGTLAHADAAQPGLDPMERSAGRDPAGL